MRKRLISLCMVLVLCLSLLPITVLAASNSYVALGDSITTGYGLGSEEQSFAKIVAEENGYTLNDDLATDGATSGDLLGVVTDQANAETLKNADLITITIGGNDLMGALYQFLADKYNETNDSDISAKDVQDALAGKEGTANLQSALIVVATSAIGDFAKSDAATAALTTFGKNLASIITAIKTVNPDVTIIVANQYNPYAYAFSSFLPAIVEAFKEGVKALNTAIQ